MAKLNTDIGSRRSEVQRLRIELRRLRIISRVAGLIGAADQSCSGAPGAEQRGRKVHASRSAGAAVTADPLSVSAAPSVVKMAPTTATVPSNAARWVDKRIAIG